MGTNKAAGEKTEDWKKQASGDERKMKWNRKLKMGIKNGSNGARTHDLSRVRRTLIPAELCFQIGTVFQLKASIALNGKICKFFVYRNQIKSEREM